MYRAMGFAHATAHHSLRKAHRSLVAEDGQGTVEYVGLILLIAGIMAAVVAIKTESGKNLGATIVHKLNQSIDAVGDPNGK
jgi:hypothetical protein